MAGSCSGAGSPGRVRVMGTRLFGVSLLAF